MRLTQLRSFHAVARAGGFTGGAKLLHISQPTVTTQVRFLEETYGAELFYRRGHKVTLTPLGEQLFEAAQKIFALESEMVHLLEDSGEIRSGHLRVGAVGPFHVTEMLARFNQRFPGLQVSVRVGNSEEMLETLVHYRTDVAVLAHFTDDPRFHFVPYRRHPVVAFVHRRHRFAARKSIRIAELAGEGLILREEGSTTRKALDDALAKAGIVPRVLMEIGSREAIREAVIMGVGVGIVSEKEYIPNPAIRMVRVSDAEMHTHAHVVCLEERRGARLVKAFLEIVADLQEEQRPARTRKKAALP
ncbi:MAG: LysR substrate-binding domain-containing protein [Pseudomonadota bacterium]|nr:LysR substrate-binding domain-containing protein [Pseudomonadota bacterium]